MWPNGNKSKYCARRVESAVAADECPWAWPEFNNHVCVCLTDEEREKSECAVYIMLPVCATTV